MPNSAAGLTRDKSHAILGGVCAGLARFLGWSRTLVRVLFVLTSILSAAFPGILVYLALWILMPATRRD